VEISLNDNVQVWLTDVGKEARCAYGTLHHELNPDGSLTVPLFALIAIFGPCLFNKVRSSSETWELAKEHNPFKGDIRIIQKPKPADYEEPEPRSGK
jgi:hypothetical protein